LIHRARIRFYVSTEKSDSPFLIFQILYIYKVRVVSIPIKYECPGTFIEFIEFIEFYRGNSGVRSGVISVFQKEERKPGQSTEAVPSNH
jgi:hypothetical protein